MCIPTECSDICTRPDALVSLSGKVKTCTGSQLLIHASSHTWVRSGGCAVCSPDHKGLQESLQGPSQCGAAEGRGVGIPWLRGSSSNRKSRSCGFVIWVAIYRNTYRHIAKLSMPALQPLFEFAATGQNLPISSTIV